MKQPSSPKKSTGTKKGKRQQKKNKKKYRVRNWREYNAALVNRGSMMFWITEEALDNWHKPENTGKRGKPVLYSSHAIETALTLQQVFHLPLRQVEGFLRSILKKLCSSCRTPDYSTLSLRGKTVPVKIRVRELRNQPLHIVVDSTGIKIFGEGEWKVRQHGWSKHRRWKKLHIGVDETTKDILVGEVSGNETADSEAFPILLNQLPPEQFINQVSADGAYDKRRCYHALRNRAVAGVAIPPQKKAKIWQHGNTKLERLTRDENLRRIRRVGRKQWKVEKNYHRRSIAETTMFRLKTIFTDRLAARTSENQQTQLLLRCKALNTMTLLGMPESHIVA